MWPSDFWDHEDDDGRPVAVSEVSSSVVCLGNDIAVRLPELVLHLVRPLADVFLTTLDRSTVERQIAELQQRRR